MHTLLLYLYAYVCVCFILLYPSKRYLQEAWTCFNIVNYLYAYVDFALLLSISPTLEPTKLTAMDVQVTSSSNRE